MLVTLHFVCHPYGGWQGPIGQEPIWQEFLVQVIIILLLGNVAQRVWPPTASTLALAGSQLGPGVKRAPLLYLGFCPKLWTTLMKATDQV